MTIKLLISITKLLISRIGIFYISYTYMPTVCLHLIFHWKHWRQSRYINIILKKSASEQYNVPQFFVMCTKPIWTVKRGGSHAMVGCISWNETSEITQPKTPAGNTNNLFFSHKECRFSELSPNFALLLLNYSFKKSVRASDSSKRPG